MKLGPGPSGLIRLAVFAGLGLFLLLSGCASTAPPAAADTTEPKHWGRCDRSRMVNVTFVCYQR